MGFRTMSRSFLVVNMASWLPLISILSLKSLIEKSWISYPSLSVIS